jgi:hypothetical protein
MRRHRGTGGRLRSFGALAMTTLGLGLVAACGTPHATSASGRCGTTRTAVNVPVIIEVSRGPVSCATAMRIEESYAAMVRAGRVRGNGGGAPVKVSGWTCQGFPTPDVLRTGKTSACRQGHAEVLAVLPPPTGSATSQASG